MSPVTGLSRNDAERVATLTAPQPVDRNRMRDIFGRFATGVTVVAAGSDAPGGMTANSFTSVSLDPPLILVCVNRQAAIHQTVLETGSFTVSVLAAGQEHVARHFANRARPRGDAEFDVVGWSPAPNTGAPVIHGSLAWLECALTAAYDGGDHSIFLGSVLATDQGPARDALIFFGGGFQGRELGRQNP
jgi:flavin reductase